MKKSLHIISMAVLGMVLLSGMVRVDAASRTLAINTADQSNKTSSEMYASKAYPISFMVVAGDTSKGDIKYEITGIDTMGAHYTISTSGTCSVGETLASSDVGGTLSPIYFSADSYVTLNISKGSIRTQYRYYIGSGFISTPTADTRSADVSVQSAELDLSGYYAELNMLADEMREKINEWDEQNTEYTEAMQK